MNGKDSKLSSDDLFQLLVSQLVSGVWVQLGKLPDPASNKIERNLDAASMTIDILDALVEKSEGNLSKELDQFVRGSLSQLKMNYLEELKKPASEKATEVENTVGDTEKNKPDAAEE